MSYFRKAYDVLTLVLVEGKYLGEALKNVREDGDKAIVTRIVYGVLEKKVQLDCTLNSLVDKSPKKAIAIILEMGLYCLRYMDSIPNYAVVDNSVRLTKELGKSGASSFVNAVLKKSLSLGEPKFANEVERLVYQTSTPLWITKKIVKQYGDRAERILSFTPTDKGHIRVNGLKTDRERVEKILKEGKVDYFPSKNGFYVSDTALVRELFGEGLITYQAESSMKIAQMLAHSKPHKILDVCSAPGGKSVYAYELTRGDITALDLHPHRVKLIESYANRMGAKIKVGVGDGLVFQKKYEGVFDAVLLDAPCSGIGTRYSKPDVLLNREESDLPEITKTQEGILENVSKYLKSGGYLVYSTCTLFYEENERVVERFLDKHPEFSIDTPKEFAKEGSYMKILPSINGNDGFFAVRLKKE